MIKKKRVNRNIMNYAGMFNDLTVEETELFTNAIQRQSLFGGRVVKNYSLTPVNAYGKSIQI